MKDTELKLKFDRIQEILLIYFKLSWKYAAFNN
jgi:hypothetical protein